MSTEAQTVNTTHVLSVRKNSFIHEGAIHSPTSLSLELFLLNYVDWLVYWLSDELAIWVHVQGLEFNSQGTSLQEEGLVKRVEEEGVGLWSSHTVHS